MNTKVVWKCMVKGCNYTAPPTPTGCKQVVGHILGHANKGIPKEERKYALVDEDTGKVLANKVDEAKKKGLLTEEPKPTETKPPEGLLGEEVAEEEEVEEEEEEESRAKEKAEKEGREVIKEISSEGIFRYTVTLPADAFTLFNIAKANGLERKDKLFDEFLWECIRARFEKDYKQQLILAPIEE